ncbi:MAG: tRNA (N6-isopentenyl adenosine(37)-C2)-methylthiotransferase MiaB [Rhodospirillaceae bacterium]|nr:tRNA (N6-isopentenyl adenosine(37)-C2)-methylthiotransferase MiaB [Rhodospirillaceae bacterium]
MTRKLFIKTFGCQMNVYDSDRMADVLAPLDFTPVQTPEDADLVILNTCHIREKAAEKVYSDLGRLRAKQDERRLAGKGEMMIAVAGCVAQAEGRGILRRAPYVNFVFGPQTYHRLPDLVREADLAGADKQSLNRVETDFPAEAKFDFLPEVSPSGPSAFLAVQEGCDKFCSFCVVPYTRGSEFSRPTADVIKEARILVAQGTREITLLGQNVNAYHGADGKGREWGLGRLIMGLAEIENLDRIRYTTSHPGDMDDALFAAHGEVPQLMPFLHLPVQSGSDRVLAAMNRRYTVDEYLRIVERLRKMRPDIVLASDFIVGYPGETQADFAATLKLVETVGYAQAYSFKYSARPGTPAAEMPDQVDGAIADARLAELQTMLNNQQTTFNRETVGRVLPVLFDRPGRHEGQIGGRSPFMQAVHVEADESLIGQIADVDIEICRAYSLAGRLIDGDESGAQNGIRRVCA